VKKEPTFEQTESYSRFSPIESYRSIASVALKPKILVVNDQIALLCNLRMRLCKLFEVETADNGLLALEKVKTKPVCYYDAILMDINMPIMDGFEAADKIN
jgi:CheY-like chemotaxis protein